MNIYRSILFIPGNKLKWMENLNTTYADAFILDLEDSVPDEEKEQARKNVSYIIDKFASDPNINIFVRINKTDNKYELKDLKAVMRLGLEGIVIPKIELPEELLSLTDTLQHLEKENKLSIGSTKILPLLETALSIYHCYEIAKHERVIGITGLSSKNGDVERALGTKWTPVGYETLYIKSKIVLAARAAGVSPIGGLWQDVHNLEGLEQSAKRNRELGFDGELIIHPSNAPIINKIYTPTEEEVKYYQGLIETFNQAKHKGEGSVIYKGSHIDLAHVQTAKEILARADMLNTKK